MTTIKRKGESEIDRNLVNEIQWLDELGQCYNYPARRKLHARLALLNTEEILSLLLFEVHRLHGRVLFGVFNDPDEEERPFTKYDKADGDEDVFQRQ